MIAEGQRYFPEAWWMLAWPSLVLARRRHPRANVASVSPIALASCRHVDEGSSAMFTSGGGGGGLPSINSPFEALIVLLFFAVVIWLIARFFNS
jgi:hypothetical protein